MWTGLSAIVIAGAFLWTKRNTVRSVTGDRAGDTGDADPSATAAEAM
jgi:hypothetical protein